MGSTARTYVRGDERNRMDHPSPDATGSPVSTTGEWTRVCRLADLTVNRGAAALVHGQAVALVRLEGGAVYAIGNHDPFDRAGMLARGIVGVRDGVPFVASPAHRHAFDLRTGHCLEDTSVGVPTYEVTVADGEVLVGPRQR
jgi:nitrite reductase (NADH) small subunit